MQALTVKEEVHRLFMPSTRVAPREYNSRPLYLYKGREFFVVLSNVLHKKEL